MPFMLPDGIYGITAEAFSGGRANVAVVRGMIDGGARIIQYREKHDRKSFRDMAAECIEIRRMTWAAGVLFIVNDYAELAMLVDADGVHIGQDDLPVAAVRERIGDKILGLSTHSPAQAVAAAAARVDYIGVGPIYKTKTKADVCDPVGLDYLDFVVSNIGIPFVAIGGIKAHNIAEVIGRGARTVALVTEIVGAGDVSGTVRALDARVRTHSVA
ncbi:MAG: thiamine phosphate synthase [Pseudomonadota bacterium]